MKEATISEEPSEKKKKGKFLLELFAAVAAELVGGRVLRFTL